MKTKLQSLHKVLDASIVCLDFYIKHNNHDLKQNLILNDKHLRNDIKHLHVAIRKVFFFIIYLVF